MNSQKKRLLLLLGAGASVDAGLPTTQMITEHFMNFSANTSRPSANLVMNLFKFLQEEIAFQSGMKVNSVDFETVLGILIDTTEERNVLSAKYISELIRSRFGQIDLDRLVRDFALYIQALCLPIRDVEHLDPLLHAVWENEGTIATLNYDVCVERRHLELNRKIKTGFGGNGKWEGFDTEEEGTELLKLHGSVGWLRQSIDLEDTFSISTFLMFHSDPFMTALHQTAKWVATENSPGVRLLMNIGISKEQLYYTTPFEELFSRLRVKLQESELILIAGYSFRDSAINRMLLDSIKHKRVPIVIIDPSVEELLEKRPIVQALKYHRVLIQSSKTIKQLTKNDIDRWLEETLDVAPKQISVPPDFDDNTTLERTHDLAIELSLLEYYLKLTLKEIDAGRCVTYGLLNCLVQSIERCRRTYFQVLISKEIAIKNSKAWHGVYSKEPINLSTCRGALADSYIRLRNILSQIDDPQYPFKIIQIEKENYDKVDNLQTFLGNILAVLQNAGVDAH